MLLRSAAGDGGQAVRRVTRKWLESEGLRLELAAVAEYFERLRELAGAGRSPAAARRPPCRRRSRARPPSPGPRMRTSASAGASASTRSWSAAEVRGCAAEDAPGGRRAGAGGRPPARRRTARRQAGWLSVITAFGRTLRRAIACSTSGRSSGSVPARAVVVYAPPCYCARSRGPDFPGVSPGREREEAEMDSEAIPSTTTPTAIPVPCRWTPSSSSATASPISARSGRRRRAS